MTVKIISSWSDAEELSLQRTAFVDVSALVQSITGVDWLSETIWQWLLVESNPPHRTIAWLTTSQSTSEETLLVSTREFPASSLRPGTSYRYALLRSTSGAPLSGIPGDLARAQDAGFMAKLSNSFIADGAPVAGVLEVVPANGSAVITNFGATTLGWQDEVSASLQYEFYRFPVSAANFTSGGTVDSLACAEACEPVVEWEDETSLRYYATLGGIRLVDWSPAAHSPELVFPNGAFLVAVRVKDHLGAMSVAYAVGPTVNPVANLEAAQALDTIRRSTSSGAPLAILNTVGDVLATAATASSEPASAWNASDRSAVRDIALSSVAAAARGLSAGGIQRLGSVLAGLVPTLTAATGELGAADLAQLAGALATGLASPAAASGLTRETAQGILESAVAILSGSTSSTPAVSFSAGARGSGGDDPADFQALASALEEVSRSLGSALAADVPEGQTTEIRALAADGWGMALQVLQGSVTETVANGLALGGGESSVVVPPGAMTAAEAGEDTGYLRRLASSVAVCNSTILHRTEYISANLYARAPIQSSWVVPQNATMVRVELRRCGVPADRLAVPLQITLPVVTDAFSDEALPLRLICLRFNEISAAWTDDGVRLEGEALATPHLRDVVCLSHLGAASYTVALSSGDELEAPGEAHEGLGPLGLAVVLILLVTACFIAALICPRIRHALHALIGEEGCLPLHRFRQRTLNETIQLLLADRSGAVGKSSCNAFRHGSQQNTVTQKIEPPPMGEPEEGWPPMDEPEEGWPTKDEEGSAQRPKGSMYADAESKAKPVVAPAAPPQCKLHQPPRVVQQLPELRGDLDLDVHQHMNLATIVEENTFTSGLSSLSDSPAASSCLDGSQARLHCPAGHKLVADKVSSLICICDVCQKEVRNGDAVYTCRLCNYDKCKECCIANEVTVVFKPGSLGLALNFSTGLVSNVDQVGQAHRASVQVGWQCVFVDGTPYCQSLLDAKTRGQSPFAVTFQVESDSCFTI